MFRIREDVFTAELQQEGTERDTAVQLLEACEVDKESLKNRLEQLQEQKDAEMLRFEKEKAQLREQMEAEVDVLIQRLRAEDLQHRKETELLETRLAEESEHHRVHKERLVEAHREELQAWQQRHTKATEEFERETATNQEHHEKILASLTAKCDTEHDLLLQAHDLDLEKMNAEIQFLKDKEMSSSAAHDSELRKVTEQHAKEIRDMAEQQDHQIQHLIQEHEAAVLMQDRNKEDELKQLEERFQMSQAHVTALRDNQKKLEKELQSTSNSQTFVPRQKADVFDGSSMSRLETVVEMLEGYNVDLKHRASDMLYSSTLRHRNRDLVRAHFLHWGRIIKVHEHEDGAHAKVQNVDQELALLSLALSKRQAETSAELTQRELQSNVRRVAWVVQRIPRKFLLCQTFYGWKSAAVLNNRQRREMTQVTAQQLFSSLDDEMIAQLAEMAVVERGPHKQRTEESSTMTRPSDRFDTIRDQQLGHAVRESVILQEFEIFKERVAALLGVRVRQRSRSRELHAWYRVSVGAIFQRFDNQREEMQDETRELRRLTENQLVARSLNEDSDGPPPNGSRLPSAGRRLSLRSDASPPRAERSRRASVWPDSGRLAAHDRRLSETPESAENPQDKMTDTESARSLRPEKWSQVHLYAKERPESFARLDALRAKLQTLEGRWAASDKESSPPRLTREGGGRPLTVEEVIASSRSTRARAHIHASTSHDTSAPSSVGYSGFAQLQSGDSVPKPTTTKRQAWSWSDLAKS